MDNGLEQFIHDLNGDIHDRAVGGATPLEDAFCELTLEYLSDAGVVENASVAKFEERIGRGIGRVGGYGINEEEDTLDLFVTVFLDAGQPTRLPPDEVRKAIEQAVRYGENALKGREKAFWDYHTRAMSKIGRNLGRGTLAWNGLLVFLDFALNPKSSIEKLIGRVRNKIQVRSAPTPATRPPAAVGLATGQRISP